MEISFEGKLRNVKVVDKSKRYWFIRTFSGEAFSHYIDGEYVGLGLNNVPLKYIKDANVDDEPTFNALYNFIDKNTDYKKGEATKWANQLIEFTNQVKIGDTVIIPGKSSDKLAFGTVTSDIFLEAKPDRIIHKGEPVSLPEKRRSVQWDKIIKRDDLQGELRGLLSSHQGITNADDFSYIIEGAQDSLFIKDEHIYLVLKLGRNEDVNAFELQRFLTGLTYFYNEFCIESGAEPNENLAIKIKLQSKGNAYLKAAIFAGIMGLSGLIMLCNNPHVEFEMNNIKFKAGSEGALKSYSDFLDRKQEREQEAIKFKDSIDRLNAKESKTESVSLVKEPGDKVQKKRK